MIEIQNKTMEELGRSKRKGDKAIVRLKSILDQKLSSNIKNSIIKNNINNVSTYSYLMLPVTNSTESIEGNDYIAPIVKKAVDYVSAAVTKCLSPNGGIKLEFVAQNEQDDLAARQATDMVSYILNSQLNFHTTLSNWVKDGCINKNGLMMIRPIREQVTSYRVVKGTLDQLKAFEQQVLDSGSTPLLSSRKKVGINLDQVRNEMASMSQSSTNQMNDEMLTTHMENLANGSEFSPEEIDEEHFAEGGPIANNMESNDNELAESMTRNTVYEAKYKITGYLLHIRLCPIKQHYWFCDSRVINVQDQAFCGFYERMSIQEATEQYPGLRLDDFTSHANPATSGLDRASGGLNDIAIHARDSIPYAGLSITEGSTMDPHSRYVGISTIWFRHDIDGDGEMELIEMIYSGGYVISAKEVEFIPVANMCPRRLPNNFFGMSVAESVVAQQEYGTGASRAQLNLAYLMASARLGVNASKLDWSMFTDGGNNVFLLNDDFDPTKHVFPVPGPSGNLSYLSDAMNSIQQDAMAVTGMVTPNDTFNPEVMADGNSGIKLQLALTPNQIILDDTSKNCAEGLKEAVWIIWRTLIQYNDDFGVKRMAREYHPNKEPVFIDGDNWGDMNFYERKDIHLELALGLLSAENNMSRLEIIKGTQAQCWQGLKQLVQDGYFTESLFTKLRKPHETVLHDLGVKDVDTVLPTLEEAIEVFKKAQQAAQAAGTDPDSLEKQSQAQLNQAKAAKLQSDISTEQDRLALEAIALRSGKATNY